MAIRLRLSKVSWLLALAFLVPALGIGTAGYVFVRHEKESYKEEKRDDLLAVSALKVRQIEKWREDRRRDGEILFNSPFIASQLEKDLKNPKGPQPNEGILSLMASLHRHGGYDSVFLLDATGSLKASIPSWRGLGGTSAQSLIVRAVHERNIVFSDLYRDAAQDRILIDLLVPILRSTNRGDRLIGMILLRTDPLHFLYPLIQVWPVPSATAESLLVRREGEEIVFLNELRHQRNTGLILRQPMSKQDLVSSMGFRGQRGIVEGVDYRGVKVLAVIREILDSPWILISKVDQEEINSPIRKRERMIVIIVGLLILAIGFSVLLIRRQQVGLILEKQYKAEIERNALTKHYEFLTKYANDIILLYDQELRLVEANERAVEAYGYTREELLQCDALKLRSPQTRPSLDATRKQVEEKRGLVFETIHQRKDGTTFPVEISTRLIEVEGKTFHQSIIRDISERKQAEKERENLINGLQSALTELKRTGEALRKSEERFRDLYDNAPVGYHEFNAEGRITHVNRTELEMMGYRPEEMLDRAVWEFNDEQERVRETVLAKLSGALPPARGFERTLRRKDGTTFPVLIEDRLLRDEKGRIAGIRATLQDITERKKIEEEREELIREIQTALVDLKEKEEALRKSEEIFRDLYDNAPIGYHEYDREGRITNVNQTELDLLGYTREEMLSRFVWELNAEEDSARTQILAKLAGQWPPAHELERNYRRKDGTSLPVLVEDRLIRDETGGIAGFRVTIQNISERKKTERERERLVDELQEALSKVKQLGGLLPICASCKKIRDDRGYWNQIETYVRDHSEAEFSHGICPECMKKLYPEFAEEEER